MGRELKRVDLNFAWPLHKVWEGFLNPHYVECKDCTACDSTGYSPFARRLYSLWWGYEPFRPEDNGCEPYTTETPHVQQFADRQVARNPEFYGTGPIAIMRNRLYISGVWNRSWSRHLNQQDIDDLVAADALPMDFKRKNRIPTVEEMGIYTCMSFGGSNMEYRLIKARCTRAGEPEHCAVCKGEGHMWTSPEAKQIAEDWKETEPPAGDGYQIWETVSEGSPVSPVFATPEELAAWMVANDTSVTKDTSYDSWLKWINGPGWSFSCAVIDGEFKDGVQERLCDGGRLNFDLHRPCDQCPFLRVGGVKHLGRRRALEIGTMLADRQGGTLPCHKTTTFGDEDGELIHRDHEQHCAGALIFAERVNPAGTQFMRIAERLGFYDRNAYTGAELVFETVEDFVEAQA